MTKHRNMSFMEMRAIKLLTNIHIVIVALILSGCLPKEQDQLECPDGQSFDTSFRKCVSDALLSNSAPFPYGDELILVSESASAPFYKDFTVTAGTDNDGDGLTYIVTSGPSYGTLSLCMNKSPDGTQPDLSCRYTPTDNDFAGTDSFTYTVNDGIINSQTTATVTISMQATNDVPVVTVDTVTSVIASGTGTSVDPYIYNVSEGDTFTIVLNADEGGYTDEDAQSMRVSVSAIAGTNASGLATSDFTHTYNIYSGSGSSAFNFQDSTNSADLYNLSTSVVLPSGALAAADDISFSLIIDDFQDTNTIYFTVNVTATDNPPVFAATTTQVAANSFAENGIQGSLNSGALRAATDPESVNTVVYEIVTAPSGEIRDCMDRDASSTVVAATTDLDCDYLPSTVSVTGGYDTFTYRACETTAGNNCSAAITVNITFTNVDDEPIFASYVAQAIGPMDEKKLISDPVLSFSAAAGSDEEDAASTLTYEIITAPNTGTEGLLRDCMDLDSSGVSTGTKTSDLDCVFDPIVGYAGVAQFTYRVCDTSGKCSDDTTPTNFATGDITVNEIDDPPVITDLANQEFNEGVSVISLDLTLDEGDGTSEDNQQLTIRVTVTSVDNPLLLPEANITVTTRDFGAYTADTDDAFTNTFDAGGANDSADTPLNLAISPVVGQTGTVTITVEANDSTTTSTETFNITINPYSALHGGWANIVAQGHYQTKDLTTISYGEGYVYLEWNTMTVAGGTSVASWNIYRDIDNDGDMIGDNGTLDITATPIANIVSSQKYYTDIDDNATNDLTEGQVYLYKVRPVAAANSLPMDVSESYAVARVLYPQSNWSFVHRWIINQENCTKMGKTPVPTQDFGCSYIGPDSTDIGGSVYYAKQVNDLIVMSYEAGCNYSAAPNCTASGCIGTKDPNVEAYDVSNGAMYYNRDTSVCYVQTAAATWTALNAATMATDLAGNSLAPTYIYNPPITNISRDQASAYCTNMTAPSFTGATPGTLALPTKFIYNALASWDDTISDTNINNYESGSSMSTSSKCNTYDADGISFVDQEVPTSSFADSLPAIASASSLSRALRTGSDASAECISRYGIQDIIGNVSEWMQGDLTCSADDTCTTTINGNGVGAHDFNFDGATGPCSDSSPADDVCDAVLNTFVIANKLNDATKFLLPVGLPLDAEEVALTSSTIGTAAGNFSPTKLHSDSIIISADLINADAGETGHISGGGSFATGGNSAGRYHMEATTFNGTLDIREDIGFRCYMEVTYP